MLEFAFADIFPLGPDVTTYRLISTEGVSTVDTTAGTFLQVTPQAITALTEIAMRDIAHLLRSSHLQQLADILKDPEASANDRFVALDLLKMQASRQVVCCQCAKTLGLQSLKPKKDSSF